MQIRNCLWSAVLAASVFVAGVAVDRLCLRRGTASSLAPTLSLAETNQTKMFVASRSQATQRTRPGSGEGNNQKINAVADVPSAIQAALAEPAGNQRATELRRVASAVRLEDIKAALPLASAIRNLQWRREFISILFGRWAEVDGAAAMEHAQHLANASE